MPLFVMVRTPQLLDLIQKFEYKHWMVKVKSSRTLLLYIIFCIKKKKVQSKTIVHVSVNNSTS